MNHQSGVLGCLKNLCAFSIRGCLVLFCWGIIHAYAYTGTLVDVEISLERSTLLVGEPLVIDMKVTNVSDVVPRVLSLFTDNLFHLTWFIGFTTDGCEIGIFGNDPERGEQPGFGYSWRLTDPEPGETATCQVTFPQTLFPGQETIEFSSSFWIGDDQNVSRHEGFTYTLLAPVAVEVSLEQSTLVVGEPLVIDIQATNIGAEALERVSIFHLDDFQLASFNGITAEGCELTIAAPEPLPGMALPGEAFFLDFQDLQAGETATCRVTLPQTLTPGQETIRLAGSGDGVFWGELAAFTYVLRGAELAPVPVPTNTRAWLLVAILMLLVIGVNRIHADQAKSHRDF